MRNLERVRRRAQTFLRQRSRRLLGAARALALPLLIGVWVGTVHAQEMEVPVSIQVPLFLKVMTFDRQRVQQNEIVVGVTFQRGYRASITTRDEVVHALRYATERKIRIVLIDLDRETLAEVLVQQQVTMLYVSPVRAHDVAAIANAAALSHVTTVTGVPKYVKLGIAVGAQLEGDRPRLLVNLAAARLCGADFTAELLKLAQVVQ